MEYKVTDGVVYEVTSSPINLAEEEKKLQWMLECLEQDRLAAIEYQEKIAAIDASDLDEETKNQAKTGCLLFGSGVTQSEADQQRAKVEEIKNLLK